RVFHLERLLDGPTEPYGSAGWCGVCRDRGRLTAAWGFQLSDRGEPARKETCRPLARTVGTCEELGNEPGANICGGSFRRLARSKTRADSEGLRDGFRTRGAGGCHRTDAARFSVDP